MPKLKYLGIYFKAGSFEVDTSVAVGKFYGNFNIILCVLGNKMDVMSAVHLVKTYCLPTLIYACESWLSFDKHKLSVIWNNCFRKIFNCCWRESVSVLQYYCNVMPLTYIIEERRLIFLNKMFHSDIYLLRLLAKYAYNDFLALASKYNVTLSHSKNEVKNRVWQSFASSVGLT